MEFVTDQPQRALDLLKRRLRNDGEFRFSATGCTSFLTRIRADRRENLPREAGGRGDQGDFRQAGAILAWKTCSSAWWKRPVPRAKRRVED